MMSILFSTQVWEQAKPLRAAKGMINWCHAVCESQSMTVSRVVLGKRIVAVKWRLNENES